MQEKPQHYIEVKNISKKYESGNNIVNAVNDVSFYVDKGEFIGVMGSSGSGKTTILNLMSTIDTLSQGHILYDKVDIVNMKEDELSEFRKKNLGFVFQDYNLLDTLNVRENILLPMALCGNSKSEIENRIMELANSLNITDILYKFPYEISGGQKQRAACARALVNFPKLILADEPTGALDSKSSVMLMNTLHTMNINLGATILMVTHDAFSACYCDRILFLNDGKICAELKHGKMEKNVYFNKILDLMTRVGGDDVYVE